MKNLSSFVLTASLLGSFATQATIFNSTGTPLIIPDGNSVGVQNTINVSGLEPNVSSLSVTLNITGGRNGDLFAYLTRDSAIAILLNRVGRGEVAGGYGGTGFQILLQDGSPDVHTYQISGFANDGEGRVLGTFGADGRSESPFSVTTSSPRTSNPFSVFTGGAANGDWTLFIADVNGNSNEAILDSWSLDITAVPEPINVALGIFGGLFAVVQGVRYWKRKNPSVA